MRTTRRFAPLAVACALAPPVLLGGCRTPTSLQPPQETTMHQHIPQPQTAPLTVQVFNPGEDAVFDFAVSSVLVEGKREALLIDAQFLTARAGKLVEQIRASGKHLTTIYISHGDPDFYFGLDTLHSAFPDAKIVATPQVVAHIEATSQEKLKIWGPRLGENAPKRIVVPQPLVGDTLTLEGQPLKVIGLDGPTPDRSFVWIPSIKTVAGGIPVVAGEHVWMADTQTPQSHAQWQATLERIKGLAPTRVIPGHFGGALPPGLEAVDFTAGYIRAFDEETAKAANAAELVAALQRRYPGLGGASALELSAKVAKGEMAWK
ncbi:MBL fold metallo-hydrolase [Xanthomonas graminis]|uniref:MBL fold metallo-hydrolase n=1 Tax=Xanthomonas graminis pv. poae TaxID=227946 RepID=A0A199NZH1_9XANT|nr:MBL fold metallo-hydrolase [Xanthomonas translucens]OAX54327.1 MBL fold metallo-hydrolase [Xanthomonas translucens pv. poae]